jgi:hypothetical protein
MYIISVWHPAYYFLIQCVETKEFFLGNTRVVYVKNLPVITEKIREMLIVKMRQIIELATQSSLHFVRRKLS